MADPQVVAAMQGLVRDPTEMSDFTDEPMPLRAIRRRRPHPPDASLRGCRRTELQGSRLIVAMTAEKLLVSVQHLAS